MKDVWSQPSWSTKWRGPKYLALIVSVLLLTLISSDWLRADQSNCVILIDSDYVQSEMQKGVIYGNSLLTDIFSHMKRKKNPGHFAPKVKVRKSDKVAVGQLLDNKGERVTMRRGGVGIMSSPQEGSARRFFVLQTPCPAPARQYETSRWWREIKRADAAPPSMHLLVLNLPNRRQSWPKAPTKLSPASKSCIPYFIYFI